MRAAYSREILCGVRGDLGCRCCQMCCPLSADFLVMFLVVVMVVVIFSMNHK